MDGIIRPRLQRSAEHLIGLGARALAEFLSEIGTEYGCTDGIVTKLMLWRARLTFVMIRAAGGDRFPPPLSPVPTDQAGGRAIRIYAILSSSGRADARERQRT